MNSTLDVLEDFLMKARRRLSDENPDYSDTDEEQDSDGLETWDEDELQGDDADAWLSQNDPAKKPEDEDMSMDEDAEYEEKPKAKAKATSPAPVIRRAAKQNTAPTPTPPAAQAQAPREPKRVVMPSPASAASATKESDDMQPTREELAQLREYTRAWSSRARDKARLEAEAHKNPGRHHEGRIVEARNLSHADRQQAYNDFTQSQDFQNADPFTQMEMEAQFHSDWEKNNPEHSVNALKAHAEAHKKGTHAKGLYAQAKDEKIRHIAGGGVNPEAVSLEEGMQHAGGSREEDDAAPSGISQDKSAAFASGNRDFVDQYMKRYDEKKKQPTGDVDPYAAADEKRADVASVIGDGPQFKDASHKRAHDMLISKYYPLIERAARRTLGKMGLTQAAESGQLDDRALHEAGIHALYQAINDYDHDHPSKASFTTHLNRKMNGLMQTALKAQDEIPAELRAGASKFKQAQRLENVAPVKHTNKEGVTTIINPGAPKPTPISGPTASPPAAPPRAPKPAMPVAPKRRPAAEVAAAHPPEIQERLKRVSALKPKRNINFVGPDEEE